MPRFAAPQGIHPMARMAPPRAPMMAQRPPMPRFAAPQGIHPMARMAPPRAPMMAQRPPMPRFAAPRGIHPMARMAPPRAPMMAQRPIPPARAMQMAQPARPWRPTPPSSRFMAGLQQRPPMIPRPEAAYGWRPAPQAQTSRQAKSEDLYRPKLAADDGNPWKGLYGG
jgi:hypothetical protein